MSTDDRLVNLIASGSVTRERHCDGKKRIRTPEHAEKLAKHHSEHYGVPQEPYFCVFCHGYHLHTVKGKK